MKRNALTTALLAGLAGAAGLASTANASPIGPDGLGDVVIYPYYTVDNAVIGADRTSVTKVRFIEGRSSVEVLDFNLYLSPFPDERRQI